MDALRPLVALVDDEESVRKALRRLLRSAGLEVQTYAGGEEFLDDLSEHLPDCVVLDIRMPNMSGYDVQARLKAAGVNCPVILMTALDEPGDSDVAMQSGAFAFLHKPFDDQVLIDYIVDAVAAHRGAGAVG